MKLGTKSIGPSFASELRAAGLSGLPISWGADADIGGAWDSLTQQQQDAVRAVYAAHDPTKPNPDVVDDAADRDSIRSVVAELLAASATPASWAALTPADRNEAVRRAVQATARLIRRIVT